MRILRKGKTFVAKYLRSGILNTIIMKVGKTIDEKY